MEGSKNYQNFYRPTAFLDILKKRSGEFFSQKFRITVCLTAKYQDLTRLLAIVSEIKQNNFLKNLKNLLNSHSNEITQISAKIVQKLVVVDIFYKKSLIIYSPVLKEKHRFSFGTFQAG